MVDVRDCEFRAPLGKEGGLALRLTMPLKRMQCYLHLASPSHVLLRLLAGKSLKTLMSKGILQVHPPICDCPGCRISSPVVRHGISWSLLGRRAGFLLQN